MDLDLERQRSPADFRNLLEVRVRRLSNTKSLEERLNALEEIAAITESAIKQHRERLPE